MEMGHNRKTETYDIRSPTESDGSVSLSKEALSRKAKWSHDDFSALRDTDAAATKREEMTLELEREERAKDRAERKEELKKDPRYRCRVC